MEGKVYNVEDEEDESLAEVKVVGNEAWEPRVYRVEPPSLVARPNEEVVGIEDQEFLSVLTISIRHLHKAVEGGQDEGEDVGVQEWPLIIHPKEVGQVLDAMNINYGRLQ
ncbi:hypothetical protein AMTR_s00019p00099310 [Amborella trichopoda]|uniref:Uncharacterized protein n=1 Tax=Amborella trichopoda TaxID=13333 RepID=W1PHK3_AMBTC|nr:hypothetical protein AMTR_s00019p00099310 [Amborella trichopoda]